MFTSQMLLAGGAAPGGGVDNRITLPSSAQAVLSVARAVDTSYSGNLIRVRRSSDDTESDIGFDGDGNLDQAALLSFTGSDSGDDGYITTVYEQVGASGNPDFTQSSAALQPAIVVDGVVQTQNGIPSARSLGTGATEAFLDIVSWTSRTTANELITVTSFSSAGRTSSAVMYSSAGGSPFVGVLTSGSGSSPHGGTGTPLYAKNGVDIPSATRGDLFTEFMDQGLAIFRISDISLAGSGWGSFRTDYTSTSFDGPEFWSEMIVLDDTHSAGDVTTIEDNQITHFGIT